MAFHLEGLLIGICTFLMKLPKTISLCRISIGTLPTTV